MFFFGRGEGGQHVENGETQKIITTGGDLGMAKSLTLLFLFENLEVGQLSLTSLSGYFLLLGKDSKMKFEGFLGPMFTNAFFFGTLT